MEEKKEIKVSLSTAFLVVAIIVIIAMGAFIYIQKTEADNKIEELENNISELQGKNEDQSNTINSNKDTEDIADITSKCKVAFEEYYDLQVEVYSGGSLYALKKLDLVSTMPTTDQYETATYEYHDFYKTDIKYSDFKNAMLKYMTSEIFEKDFERYHAKNVDGYLQITAMGGTATYINIDKMELFSNNNGVYTFNISAEMRADDNPSKETVNIKATFEKQNGNYVVSSVEINEYLELTSELNSKDVLYVTKAEKNSDNAYTLYGVVFKCDGEIETQIGYEWSLTKDYKKITIPANTICISAYPQEEETTVGEYFKDYEEIEVKNDRNPYDKGTYIFEFENGKCVKVIDFCTSV